MSKTVNVRIRISEEKKRQIEKIKDKTGWTETAIWERATDQLAEKLKIKTGFTKPVKEAFEEGVRK